MLVIPKQYSVKQVQLILLQCSKQRTGASYINRDMQP